MEEESCFVSESRDTAKEVKPEETLSHGYQGR